MLTEKLLQLGFTPAQAAVLEAVVKLGESKAGAIIKRTELQSSVVYNALRQLESQGLISRIRKNTVQFYACPDIEQIARNTQKKLEVAKEITKEMTAIAAIEKTDTHAHVFYGWDGIQSAYEYALKRADSKETRYFSVPANWLTERTRLFFEHVDMLQKDCGQHVRGIAKNIEKKSFKTYTASQIKYTDSPIPLGTVIIGKCLFILSFTDKPRAVVIESEEIAAIYRQMWDQIWEFF